MSIRPALNYSEDVMIGVKLPKEDVAALDALAHKTWSKRSTVLREAVLCGLPVLANGALELNGVNPLMEAVNSHHQIEILKPEIRKPGRPKLELKSPQPETVFLSAPIGMYDTRLYDRVLARIEKKHPGGNILSARDLWISDEHWLATYESILAAVTHVCLITYPDATIGAGAWRELRYLDRRPCGRPAIKVVRPTGCRGIKFADFYNLLPCENPAMQRACYVQSVKGRAQRIRRSLPIPAPAEFYPNGFA